MKLRRNTPPLRGEGVKTDHATRFVTGDRVEICVDETYPQAKGKDGDSRNRVWIPGMYVQRIGTMRHVVIADGTGSPFTRRCEVSSKSIKLIAHRVTA
jgi:hypothetical protein